MLSLARLQWQCRRGTKELDLLLMNYLASDYPVAYTKEKKLFNELVKLEDDQLIATILGGKVVDKEELRSLVEKIKEHSLILA